MWGVECGVWGAGCKVWGVGCGVSHEVWGIGCKVPGTGCGVSHQRSGRVRPNSEKEVELAQLPVGVSFKGMN